MRKRKAKGVDVRVVTPGDRLSLIASQVGARYGFRNVEARFAHLDGTDVEWKSPGRGKLVLRVSDWFANAGDEDLRMVVREAVHNIVTGGWEQRRTREFVELGRWRWPGGTSPRTGTGTCPASRS